LLGVHVARLVHGDLDPTSSIVFNLGAHSFIPISQQTANCCTNRPCRSVFVNNSIRSPDSRFSIPPPDPLRPFRCKGSDVGHVCPRVAPSSSQLRVTQYEFLLGTQPIFDVVPILPAT
jgi:hypothetical protein